MRDKYAKTNIELKHNSMNIIAYRVKQKFLEHGITLEKTGYIGNQRPTPDGKGSKPH
jgi:hypothetical protein